MKNTLAFAVLSRGFFNLQALVDAPDMVRTQMNFKRLSLTDITIDIKRVPKKKTLIAAMEAAGEYMMVDHVFGFPVVACIVPKLNS